MMPPVLRQAPGLLISALLILIALPAVADDSALPPGWRYPTRSETAQSWRDGRQDRSLAARADFDGDGVVDRVAILFSEERSWRGAPRSIGLFVWSGSGGTPRSLHVQEGVLPVDIPAVGVSILQAGRHTTACGIGVWECAPDEPATLELKNPAILYFHYESHAAAYYWSAADSAWRAVGMSD